MIFLAAHELYQITLLIFLELDLLEIEGVFFRKKGMFRHDSPTHEEK